MMGAIRFTFIIMICGGGRFGWSTITTISVIGTVHYY